MALAVKNLPANTGDRRDTEWDEGGNPGPPDSSQTAGKLQGVSLGSAAQLLPSLGLGSHSNHWETLALELSSAQACVLGPACPCRSACWPPP